LQTKNKGSFTNGSEEAGASIASEAGKYLKKSVLNWVMMLSLFLKMQTLTKL
jgi:hypothetical protein